MAYATQQDLVLAYGADEVVRSADRDGDGVADVGVVDQALVAATDVINSRLAVVFELPLSPAAAERLRGYCCDIALYRMSLDTATYTKEKRQRYEDALAFLKDVVEGKATLEPGADEGGGGAVERFRMVAEPRSWRRREAGGVL